MTQVADLRLRLRSWPVVREENRLGVPARRLSPAVRRQSLVCVALG
jgi:hypothetical protein